MNNGKSYFDLDVGKAFAGFSFPGFDVDSILAAQRKNLEAFTQANQFAVEGIQALAKRQVEIVSAAIEEASTALRDLTAPGAPEEMIAKTNEQTFGVLNRRFTEGFEELKTFAVKK